MSASSRPRFAGPPRTESLFLALLSLAGCRYEVRLDGQSDAGLRDTRLAADAPRDRDAREALDVRPDGSEDAPIPPTCETGLRLLDARASSEAEAATSAATGEGAGRRFAVLVPPAVRGDGAGTSRLLVLDGEGTVLSSREISIVDAAGAPSSSATLHALPTGTGFLLLGPLSIMLLTADGEEAAAPALLDDPPLPGWQRGAGWVDDDRFVFVSSALRAPLVAFNRITNAISRGSIETEGAAVVLVHRGGVTVGTDEAAGGVAETVEYAATLAGEVTFRSAWPEAPLGARLLGVNTSMGVRSWLVADGAEFRNSVALYEVPDVGAPILRATTLLVAPLSSVPNAELVSLRASSEPLVALDFARRTFTVLSPPGPSSLGLVERDGDAGYVTVYLETASSPALVFRCVR